ncbi:hypothetical protein J6590_041740 [Homalodisca vitripennis]|nr:hypothetical protein J6590_041740 [Homalodisca vitripennis]
MSPVNSSNHTPYPSTSTPLNNEKTVDSHNITKDAAVNTTIDLDLNFRLNALTDRCIQLDLSTRQDNNPSEVPELNKDQTKESNNPDFQTQILLKELKSAKNEIDNLKVVIDLLRVDNEKLTAELNEARSGVKQKKQILVKNRCSRINESNQLVIMADSHGKNISSLVQQRTLRSVLSYVRPGAKFSQVTDEVTNVRKNLTKDDYLLIMAGSNDVETSGINRLTQNVQELIKNTADTNLIIATLPMRHDRPALDLKISKLNTELEKLILESPLKPQILPLHLLPRHLFTNHGLHLNKKGKDKVAEMIAKLLLQACKPNISEVKELPTKMNCENPKINIKVGKIQVVEAEMGGVIEEYKNDTSVAFAHAISSDFHHYRHMSAGVAVVFRNKFGRPQPKDCVWEKLACQEIDDGAVVYSLVTKSSYCGKPEMIDYGAAFNQLTQDFTTRGTLSCPNNLPLTLLIFKTPQVHLSALCPVINQQREGHSDADSPTLSSYKN